MRPENVALFDMDGTLCDYRKRLDESMAHLKSPEEPPYDIFKRGDTPDCLNARRNLITSKTSWWESLPKLQAGFDIWHIAEGLGYRMMILTQGPKRNPKSWMGKKMWIDKHLGTDVDITVTRDKSLTYGRVLVDDYPDYITGWLKWRPRGLVIMPSHDYNESFVHPQVIRYTGRNIREVKNAMCARLIKEE